MDPLAHTLVGAALGRAVAGRDVPAADWIGAIAANAPDWSELVLNPDLWPPRAGGEYLVFHRGITHSFVGAVVEAAVLTGLFGLVLRLWARRAMVPLPPWRWVAACVAATVASHLYLDWQGSYGLRPFLPWSARWYYGDWVAIVDPFFWVVPLVASGAGRPRRAPRAAPPRRTDRRSRPSRRSTTARSRAGTVANRRIPASRGTGDSRRSRRHRRQPSARAVGAPSPDAPTVAARGQTNRSGPRPRPRHPRRSA